MIKWQLPTADRVWGVCVGGQPWCVIKILALTFSWVKQQSHQSPSHLLSSAGGLPGQLPLEGLRDRIKIVDTFIHLLLLKRRSSDYIISILVMKIICYYNICTG